MRATIEKRGNPQSVLNCIVQTKHSFSRAKRPPLRGAFCALIHTRSFTVRSARTYTAGITNKKSYMDNVEYKVLDDVEIEGTQYAAGETVSLDADTAASLIESGKIEAAEVGEEEE